MSTWIFMKWQKRQLTYNRNVKPNKRIDFSQNGRIDWSRLWIIQCWAKWSNRFVKVKNNSFRHITKNVKSNLVETYFFTKWHKNSFRHPKKMSIEMVKFDARLLKHFHWQFFNLWINNLWCIWIGQIRPGVKVMNIFLVGCWFHVRPSDFYNLGLFPQKNKMLF